MARTNTAPDDRRRHHRATRVGAAVPTNLRSLASNSHGPDLPDIHRRAADYVDRILKGAKPRDWPSNLPTKCEFVINLKTAQALELAWPAGFVTARDRLKAVLLRRRRNTSASADARRRDCSRRRSSCRSCAPLTDGGLRALDATPWTRIAGDSNQPFFGIRSRRSLFFR